MQTVLQEHGNHNEKNQTQYEVGIHFRMSPEFEAFNFGDVSSVKSDEHGYNYHKSEEVL